MERCTHAAAVACGCPAVSAIPRLSILHAELALRADKLYSDAIALAMECPEGPKALLGQASEILGQAVRELLTVRR